MSTKLWYTEWKQPTFFFCSLRLMSICWDSTGTALALCSAVFSLGAGLKWSWSTCWWRSGRWRGLHGRSSSCPWWPCRSWGQARRACWARRGGRGSGREPPGWPGSGSKGWAADKTLRGLSFQHRCHARRCWGCPRGRDWPPRWGQRSTSGSSWPCWDNRHRSKPKD